MRIKLALLDGDVSYLDRLSSALTSRYPDKLEIYAFTAKDLAMRMVQEARVDVFIADRAFEIDLDELPSYCGFAYFIDSSNIEAVRGTLAISKYQKIETIYKHVLGIYTEHMSDSLERKVGTESQTQVIAFVSASGGTGCSTAAAACATSLASEGYKTLYINFEQLGQEGTFFSGEGQSDLSDIIYTLKSKRANLVLRLESYVRQDASGVYFYASPKTALDLLEFNTEELERLVDSLRMGASYQFIVIDLNFSFDPRVMTILQSATHIIFVCDGSEISLRKLDRAYAALASLDERSDTLLLPRVSVFYNKFRSRTGRKTDIGMRELGGSPYYDQGTAKQIVKQLVALGIFKKLALEAPRF